MSIKHDVLESIFAIVFLFVGVWFIMFVVFTVCGLLGGQSLSEALSF